MNDHSLAEPRHCGQCGVVLSAYALEGLCGNCLLKPGLGPMPETLNETEGGSKFPAMRVRSTRSTHTETVGRFGDYELLEEIARGGMGVVYRARQVSLDRIVAVKMLLAGPLAGKDFVQRFRTEAAAAASLQHPNIVAIHEVGYAEGQHFFAMDFVEGLTLAQLVAQGPLPAPQAARYLKTVAEAIHFAHERNVLHRDLKPSNVLVDSATDQPWVTDFGLAKRLEAETDLTLTGQLLGSPNYMSPEQAKAKRGTVGKRTDVYSLGAILYHLLTGRPPFQGETLTEVLRQLADTDPLAPHLLIPRVPPDLETICVKCLEKEPAKRYVSALELAEELGRFLRHEPILAHPVSRVERAWRWCRRKPALASLGGSLLLVVALGFTTTLWQWRQAMHNAEAEAKERQRAEENLYFAEMHGAETALADGDLGRARELVEHWPKAGQDDLRDFEWRLLWQRCRGDDLYALRGHSNLVNALRFSPDGDTLATRSLDNHLKVWDLTTRTERFTITNVTTLGGFTIDGQAFAFGTGDGSVKLCEAGTGRIIHSLEKAGDLVALLADGKTVATTAAGFIVKLWDIASGQKMSELPGKGGINVWLPEFGAGVVITPDGKKLAVSNGYTNGLGMGVTLWDVATQAIVKPSFDKRELTLTFLVLSPDGKVRTALAYQRHAKKLNTAFVDTHVEPLKVDVLFFSTDDQDRRRWFRDDQPHREWIE
jgi:prepilin-type processing-associated H-X9-DG protein